MGLLKKDVFITIHSTIKHNDEVEQTSEQHKGQYYKRAELEVLMYTDKQNEIGEIKNTLTIQPEKVSVKRQGALHMHQLFIVGQKTECIYRHPYGRFLMEIDTHSIDIVYEENNQTHVIIEYDMILEDEKRFYTITLEYTEVQ